MSEVQTRKEYKALVIILRVIDVATDQVESEVVKTIDSADRRAWITKTIMWATLNKKYVEIINKDDDAAVSFAKSK